MVLLWLLCCLLPHIARTMYVEERAAPDLSTYNSVEDTSAPDLSTYNYVEERVPPELHTYNYAEETVPPELHTYNVDEAYLRRDTGDFNPEEEEPFELTNPDVVDGHNLFEKDIMLTEAQWKKVLTRKGLADENRRWPEDASGTPRVPYRFADANVDQQAVLAGIRHWETHTCIRFELITDTNQPHLMFRELSGCSSHLGYLGRVRPNGQNISIGQGCRSLGTVAHEIGHSMGFFHEQSRPDRDLFVHVNSENVQSGRLGNFEKESDSVVNNQNVPYDFRSVMHYGGKYFSINEHLTLATVDPRDQELIGKRIGLSHMDKLIANRMYSCIDKWLQKCGFFADPCQNDGYTGESCTCVCPEGTSGTHCETVTGDYHASYRSACNEIITSPTTISSPGYPNGYPSGLTCAKWIKSPENMLPKITFTDFRLTNCDYWTNDYLEIRIGNLFDGDFYCDSEIAANTSFVGKTREVILMFYTRTSFGVGWQADVTFFDPSITTTTTPEPPTTTATPPEVTITPTGSPSCTLYSFSNKVDWTSPYFGVAIYPNDFQCGVMGSYDGPLMTKYTFNTFQLEDEFGRRGELCYDYVGIPIPFKRTMRFCGSQTGYLNVPNFRFSTQFVSDYSITDVGFNISISWEVTDCHRIIQLSKTHSTGTISSPNYPGAYPDQAACEWWIVAPEGRKVFLQFTDIQVSDPDCEAFYIAVDKSGSGDYSPENSNLICNGGKQSFTSDGESMNVAFYGRAMSNAKFSATYSMQ